MSTASNAPVHQQQQGHRIRVSNISRHVEREVVERLFSFMGEITGLDVRASSINPEVREAGVEFRDAASARAAEFLTGTEVADRALVITADHGSPAAAPIGAPAAVAGSAGGAHGQPLANAAVVAMLAARPRSLGAIPAAVAAVIHPSVLQFDPVKAEEISRTVYVGNIASWVAEQQLMDFFAACGPVAYVKMAGDGMQPTRFAFVEFADVRTAQAALLMNGMMLADRPLKVNHSKNSINKPQPQPQQQLQLQLQLQLQQQLGGGGGALHHRSSGALLGPSVPTLAAIASLPGSVDPVAASLLAANNTVQARLQAVRQQQNQNQVPQAQQPGAGLAWPVLGSVNPLAPAPAAGGAADDEQLVARRIRELQTQMEDKYAAERRRRRRGSRSEGRHSRSRRHDDSDDDDCYSARRSSRRRRRRSPSAARESSRRRRDGASPPPPPPSHPPRSSSPSARSRRRRRDADADDEHYWRDRGAYARP
ncbi:hypothetical protein LPJ72_004620 [Coemansia sp. Benny D160-2]|nr:hypothetical protein LPJ72_004620 [Coemansia sp. Benny D160-2]